MLPVLWIVFPTREIDSCGVFYIFPISAFDRGHTFLKITGEDSLIPCHSKPNSDAGGEILEKLALASSSQSMPNTKYSASQRPKCQFPTLFLQSSSSSYWAIEKGTIKDGFPWRLTEDHHLVLRQEPCQDFAWSPRTRAQKCKNHIEDDLKKYLNPVFWNHTGIKSDTTVWTSHYPSLLI